MTTATPWSCRACCEKESRRYLYPAQPDAYCASCLQPMSLEEQALTVLRLLLRSQQFSDVLTTVEPQRPTEEQLLSIPQAAELLGKSPKALYAQASRGSLPGAVRVGRTLRVRRSALLGSATGKRVSPGRTRR